MMKIAGLPAKVHSSGIHRIPAGIRGKDLLPNLPGFLKNLITIYITSCNHTLSHCNFFFFDCWDSSTT